MIKEQKIRSIFELSVAISGPKWAVQALFFAELASSLFKTAARHVGKAGFSALILFRREEIYGGGLHAFCVLAGIRYEVGGKKI